jgi:hypothetical protein
MYSVATHDNGTKQYELADRVIASDVSLSELRPAPPTVRPEWRLTMAAWPAPGIRRPFHHWNSANGERWATFGHAGNSLLVHFARTATFAVDDKAREIRCHPIGRSGPDALRPVVLNQLLPLLFGIDRLVLHASAVATSAGALVFVGRAGAGKSTIAAALALRGFPLITDDFLIIEQTQTVPHAVPSKVEPRLWPESVVALLGDQRFPAVGQRTTKRRISPASAAGVVLAETPVPVHRIYLLPATETEPVGRVTPPATLAALTACAFIARVDDRDVARATFERVTTLIRQVRVQQLGWLGDFAALNAFCDEVCGEQQVAPC